jgi:membrane protein YqaA with SNARE-associated domain
MMKESTKETIKTVAKKMTLISMSIVSAAVAVILFLNYDVTLVPTMMGASAASVIFGCFAMES